MATTPQDIPGLESQISALGPKESEIQSRLNASPTALGGEGTPTSSDIANQQSLQRIQSQVKNLTDQKLKTQWYGSDKPAVIAPTQQEGGSMGFFGTALDALQRPLYGVVGAVKHVIGQGAGSLQQDVASNILQNKNTFGDVLKSANVPWGVAAPLGFALDVGMDPVNWLTMGTSALVPRLGMGIYKGLETGEGVVKGFTTAAKSSLLEGATTAARFTPFVKGTEQFSNLATKSMEATQNWERLSGVTAESIIGQSGFVGGFKTGLGDVMNKVADQIPGGQDFLQHFIYDPTEWVRQARIKDIVQQHLGIGVEATKDAVNARVAGKSIEPFMKQATEEAAAKIAETPIGKGFNINLDGQSGLASAQEIDQAITKLQATGNDVNKIQTAASDIVHSVDDVASINKNPRAFGTADPIESALRMANAKVGGTEITLEELQKIVNSGTLDQTGVKWFDNMMNGVYELQNGKQVLVREGIRTYTIKLDRNADKAIEIGKTTMSYYDRGMALFKASKVAASPSSWVNAVAGNMIMAHMAGNLTPTFMFRLGQTQAMYRNRTGAAALLDSILMDAGGSEDIIRKAMKEYGTASKATFGSINFLGSADYANTAERLLMHGRDGGIVSSNTTAADIMPQLKSAMTDIMRDVQETMGKVRPDIAAKQAEVAAKGAEELQGAMLHGDLGPNVARETIAKKGFEKTAKIDLPSGMMSQDLYQQKVAAEMFAKMAKRAKDNPNNIVYKLLDFSFNKMAAGYEGIDQSFKLATFVNATVDGFNLNQLRQMRHLVDISPEELSLGKYLDLKSDPYAKTLLTSEPNHKFTGQILYRLSPKTATEMGNAMYLNYAAMPSAVQVLKNLPIVGSPFVSFMYGMALKTGQTLAYNPSAFNKVSNAINDFGGTKNPLEKKALDNQFYSYLKQPGMFRIPFFDQYPHYLNLSSMIPYYSLNMFNPSQSKYGTSTREKIAQTIQDSPLLKDPVGSNFFDFYILPLILGEAIRPQGQFGQPLYPIDATGVEKAGYALRSGVEAMVPSSWAYAGLVGGAVAPGITGKVPLYRYRALAEAVQGKSPLGISGKEDPMARTVRGTLQASGVPLQAPVNTTFGQAGQPVQAQ